MLLTDAPAIRLEEARSVDELAGLEEAWRELQQQSTAAGVFGTFRWNQAVARHHARNAELLVMLAESANRPVAVVPLARRRFLGMDTLVFLGSGLTDYSIADYQDALLADRDVEEALDAIVTRLADESCDLLWLQDLPSSSRLLELLPEKLERAGLRVRITPGNDVHRVDLPGSWQDYLSGLSSSWRKEIVRKQRRFEAEHAGGYRLVHERREIEPAMQTLFELHTQRWNSAGAPGIFDTAEARAFYMDLAHSMYERDSLYLSLLETPDGPVGAGLGFDVGGTRYAYTYGYKPGPEWEKVSLGLLLDCLSIRTGIEAGLERVDLLRNEGAYKQRYGVVSDHNYELRAYRSRSAFVRDRAYWRLRAAARRVLKRGHA
ncbi:MAG TPA: GNAT family N-acetyltransferase [Dehalococcoidia bacterium]|nr:GNAT family N-acetyltransferase [Dehalococcoidia bacterium]